MTFVKAKFPTSKSLYHLGISQYHSTYGIVYSDSSFGVGVPFYSSKTMSIVFYSSSQHGVRLDFLINGIFFCQEVIFPRIKRK